MFRKKVQRAAVLITAALVLSGCNWTQLNRWQQQTGIDLSVEDERELLALPDYMPDSCVQVVTGLRARGLTEEGLVKAERYGKRESRCCPNVVGGDTVGATCDVIGRVKGMDKTDTGLFQFNGYFPGGGVKDGTPAKRFCTEGVRRFRDGAWTDEFTHPCNQWEVLADPELQKDMMYDLVLHCGFGSWEPIRQSSGKMTYPCKNGLVWIATPEPFMNPAA